MQSSPHSHVLPKPGLGRQGRKSSTHRCCTRSPQQAGASIRNITKASWRVSLLGSDYQINHFGGCGLPVLFFPGVPVAVGVRCAVVCGGVVRSLHPYITAARCFSRLPGKNFCGGLPLPVALPLPVGLGWLVAPLPVARCGCSLHPLYDHITGIFPAF